MLLLRLLLMHLVLPSASGVATAIALLRVLRLVVRRRRLVEGMVRVVVSVAVAVGEREGRELRASDASAAAVTQLGQDRSQHVEVDRPVVGNGGT